MKVIQDSPSDLSQIQPSMRGCFSKWRNFYSVPIAERFWSKVDKRTVTECWEWKKERVPGKFNYGIFIVEGRPHRKRIVAHRYAWILTHGEIHGDLNVCHHCDNPPCCNPAHLFLGTDRDNILDMDAKGRRNQVRGERIWSARMSAEDVLKIRQLYQATKTPYRVIAKSYGVSKSCIQHIVARHKWKHI